MALNLWQKSTAAVAARSRCLFRHENTRSVGYNSPSPFSWRKDSDGKLTHLVVTHPYQTGGPVRPLLLTRVKDGVLLRVNMPGVGEGGYKVEMEDNTIRFQGSAGEAKDEYDNPRSYAGGCSLKPEKFLIEEYEAKIKNGVLMIHVKGQLKNPVSHFLSPLPSDIDILSYSVADRESMSIGSAEWV